MGRLFTVVIAVGLVAGCSGSTPPAGTPTAPQSTTVTTTSPTTTTTEAPPVTWRRDTDPGPPKVFHIEWGPVNGQYVTELPSVIGGVRPEAEVDLNGVPLPLRFIGGWGGWGDIYVFNTGEFTDDGFVPVEVPLEPGRNLLAYTARYPDETTSRIYRTVMYDPTLDHETGWVIDLIPGDPPLAVIDFAEIGNEDDGLYPIDEPVRRSVPVAEDAAFIILEVDTPGNNPWFVRSFAEVHGLLERQRQGDPLDFVYGGLLGASDIFLTPEGQLQQVHVMWTP